MRLPKRQATRPRPPSPGIPNTEVSLIHVVLALLAVVVPHHHRHHRYHATNHGCHSRACDARVGRRWAATHRPTWAIPWYIVDCESKGQNLSPNSAGAAGYYQITEWYEKGGHGAPYANEHSKAEQDAMAARIWDGGRGASQWVCA